MPNKHIENVRKQFDLQCEKFKDKTNPIERSKVDGSSGSKKIIRLTQADFNPGTTIVLDQPNTTYLLTENVTFRPSASVIMMEVIADNVTFNLKGFTIDGPGVPNEDLLVISITVENVQNFKLLNGTIQNFFRGINLLSSTNVKIKCITIKNMGNLNILSAFGIAGSFIKNFPFVVSKLIRYNVKV